MDFDLSGGLGLIAPEIPVALGGQGVDRLLRHHRRGDRAGRPHQIMKLVIVRQYLGRELAP